MSDVTRRTTALHLISGLLMEMSGEENDGGNWRQYWVSGCDRMCWCCWDVTPQFGNLENMCLLPVLTAATSGLHSSQR